MKKTFYIFSVAAALLAAGCNKSEQPAATPSEPQGPAEESGIVLYAQDINAIDSPAMKTVTEEDKNNGKFTVKWANGDQIAVYTVPAGIDPTTLDQTAWTASQPVRFKTDRATEGELRVFTLNETDSDSKKVTAFKERYAAGNLDWYAVYPGMMETPSKPGKGMISFGIEPNGNVIQNGNDNMDHLSRRDVLFGKAYDTKTPVIEMQHLGTLMEFAVSNGTAEPFTVKSITVSTSVVIAGEFRLNLSKDQLIDKTDGFKQSGICTLDVKEAKPVGAGETAKFYQVLAPFELGNGKTITISIETDKGDWFKTMTVGEKGLAFEAGMKNTAKLNVDKLLLEPLTEHTGLNVRFSNSHNNSGYCLVNLTDATLQRQGDVAGKPEEQEKLDIAAFAGSGGTVPAISAPDYQYVPYDMVKAWSVRNSTKLLVLQKANYDDFTTPSQIAMRFNYAGEPRVDIKIGDVIAAKLANGNYALIQVVEFKYDTAETPLPEYVVLNVKTVK